MSEFKKKLEEGLREALTEAPGDVGRALGGRGNPKYPPTIWIRKIDTHLDKINQYFETLLTNEQDSEFFKSAIDKHVSQLKIIASRLSNGESAGLKENDDEIGEGRKSDKKSKRNRPPRKNKKRAHQKPNERRPSKLGNQDDDSKYGYDYEADFEEIK